VKADELLAGVLYLIEAMAVFKEVSGVVDELL